MSVWCMDGVLFFFFFKQKTAYEMRISDWSSDVCSSDLLSSRPSEQREREPGSIDGPGAGPSPRIFDWGPVKSAKDNMKWSKMGPRPERVTAMGPGSRPLALAWPGRSAERRVGEDGVRTGRSRW